MLRLFFVMLLPLSLLFGEAIPFREQRYLYALDKTVEREGVISFTKEGLDITYAKDLQRVLYRQERLILVEGEKKKVIDLKKDIATKMFFVLLNSIFHNNIEQLRQFFAIETKGSRTTLLPKEPISKRLAKVVYQKKKRLDFLHIYMKNGDWISIEQSE